MVHRIFRAEDAAALLNWTLMYEVAGTAHFSGRPIEGWRSLHSYRAMGKANFEQVARDFTCGGTIDYLVYPPGHALELDDLLRGKYATQDLPGMALGSPGAYLRQRGCSVAHLLGVASVEIPTPHRETIEANRLGISDASLLPRVRTFVLRLEHAAARWFILQIPFRHGLVFLGSGLAVLLMSWGMHRSRNRQTVTYLFAAGFALLCPLLVITPASDWRYLMPANVCWICSILISLASLPYFEPGSARFPAALRREVALGHDEAPVADRGMITGRRR